MKLSVNSILALTAAVGSVAALPVASDGPGTTESPNKGPNWPIGPQKRDHQTGSNPYDWQPSKRHADDGPVVAGTGEPQQQPWGVSKTKRTGDVRRSNSERQEVQGVGHYDPNTDTWTFSKRMAQGGPELPPQDSGSPASPTGGADSAQNVSGLTNSAPVAGTGGYTQQPWGVGGEPVVQGVGQPQTQGVGPVRRKDSNGYYVQAYGNYDAKTGTWSKQKRMAQGGPELPPQDSGAPSSPTGADDAQKVSALTSGQSGAGAGASAQAPWSVSPDPGVGEPVIQGVGHVRRKDSNGYYVQAYGNYDAKTGTWSKQKRMAQGGPELPPQDSGAPSSPTGGADGAQNVSGLTNGGPVVAGTGAQQTWGVGDEQTQGVGHVRRTDSNGYYIQGYGYYNAETNTWSKQKRTARAVPEIPPPDGNETGPHHQNRPSLNARGLEAVGLSDTQQTHVQAIVKEILNEGLGTAACVVTVTTALTESGIQVLANNAAPASNNYPHDGSGSDQDSVGVFQQRVQFYPDLGCTMDPACSTRLFLQRLKAVSGWETMETGKACQAVQISDKPDAYEPKVPHAKDICKAAGFQ